MEPSPPLPTSWKLVIVLGCTWATAHIVHYVAPGLRLVKEDEYARIHRIICTKGITAARSMTLGELSEELRGYGSIWRNLADSNEKGVRKSFTVVRLIGVVTSLNLPVHPLVLFVSLNIAGNMIKQNLFVSLDIADNVIKQNEALRKRYSKVNGDKLLFLLVQALLPLCSLGMHRLVFDFLGALFWLMLAIMGWNILYMRI